MHQNVNEHVSGTDAVVLFLDPRHRPRRGRSATATALGLLGIGVGHCRAPVGVRESAREAAQDAAQNAVRDVAVFRSRPALLALLAFSLVIFAK